MEAAASVLLYGATGRSGRALAGALADVPGGLLLAGRSPDRLEAVARAFGLPFLAFPVEELPAAVRNMRGLRLVLNAAGPFAATARPMMEAAIALGLDYLDLAGEWPVFAEAEALGDAARAAGTMLMPGAAFSVAASDTLLLATSRLLARPRVLRLAVSRAHPLSPGSRASALGLFGPSVHMRVEGRIVPRPVGRDLHAFDFGDGLRPAMAVSFPDIVTARVATGVETVETWAETDSASRLALFATGPVWPLAERTGLGRLAAAASDAALRRDGRQRQGLVLVGEAEDRYRRTAQLRMHTADGYTATTRIASQIVRRVLAGQRRAGFLTPAGLFGPGFLEEIGAGRLVPAGYGVPRP